MNTVTKKRTESPFVTALQWHIDEEASELWEESPVNRFISPSPVLPPEEDAPIDKLPARQVYSDNTERFAATHLSTAGKPAGKPQKLPPGVAEKRSEALKLATEARSLSELKEAILAFQGLSLKNTATNMVFSDGFPDAKVMIVGGAPDTDEDRLGLPFVGVSGMLLDRIFAHIGLSRKNESPETGLYISNILNWRPPGNRTPNQDEIAVSLPFIERHIALAAPEILVFAGGIAVNSLLKREEGMSKLRGQWHQYRLDGANEKPEIAAMPTYHPSYLLGNPAQKKAVWADILMIRNKLTTLNSD